MPALLSKKKCGLCMQEKDSECFYKRSRSPDGLQSYCKSCDKKKTLEQRSTPAGREYVKQWRSTPAGIDSTRKYLESEAGRKKHCESSKRHRVSNREKALARSSVNNAIKAGEIIKPSCCERCGTPESTLRDGRSSIQGHHPDHSKPLDVIWLCISCHRIADNE
jgi:hypothetical protein